MLHCHAGVSWSRSVAAGIAEVFGLPYRWTVLNAYALVVVVARLPTIWRSNARDNTQPWPRLSKQLARISLIRRPRLLHADNHPSLHAAAFITTFPAPLGEQATPPAVLDLLRIDAPAPLQREESLRSAVRDMLRHGGYKPTGRGKPASEYLVRAANEDRFEHRLHSERDLGLRRIRGQDS